MKIDWTQPLFTAWCYTLGFITAYGGVRGNVAFAVWAIHVALLVGIGWIDGWYTIEKRRGRLPRETCLHYPHNY